MKNITQVLKSIIMGLMIGAAILLLKNQYAQYLLEHADYGIPMLISQKQIDNLFLGSSTFRQGLDIGQIEEALGENSFILSYDGNQPVMEYLELKYLYEHGVEIEKLYMDFYPFTAAAPFKVSDKKIFLETDLHFKNEIAKILTTDKNNWGGIAEMYISANNELLLTWPLAYPFINRRFHKGGSVGETLPATKQELEALPVPAASQLEPVQMEALEKLLLLAKENDTEVFFIETPKYGTVYKAGDYSRLLKEMKEWLNKRGVHCIMTCSPEICNLSASIVPWDMEGVEYYSDLIHLSGQGRKEFTRILLKWIQENE